MKKIIVIFSILTSSLVYAQPDLEDGDGIVPVDGGLSLLLAAGAAFGSRRLYRQGAKRQKA